MNQGNKYIMNAAQRRDIADAILLRSPESLQSIIDQGYDINTPLSTGSIYNFNLDTYVVMTLIPLRKKSSHSTNPSYAR